MAGRRGHGQKQWKPGQRVLIYVRVSKIGDRADTLISDEVQEAECRRWAEREGLVVVGEPITDLDKTGREMSKRQIAKSIERVRRGEADGIVVWKISRWGRNLSDSLVHVQKLQEAGGFIGSATENLDDVETPHGKFSLSLLLSLAQLQSDQIGETWTNIHEYRRERGLPHSAGPRWGYEWHRDVGRDDDPSLVYTIDPKTGPWLRRCYEEFVAGKTVTKLVFELNENGIRTTRGGRWSARTLLKALDSGFGAGLIIDRRGAGQHVDNPNEVSYYEGAHEAVISRSTWDAYVKKRARKVPPREAAAATRLSGLLYCASCARKLRIFWSTNGSGRNRDRPRSYQRHRGYECGRDKHDNQATVLCPSPVAIRQSAAEASVYEWLMAHARGEQSFQAALAQQEQREKAQADAEAIDAEIMRLRRRRKRLLSEFLDVEDEDPDARAELEEMRDEISAEIKTLTARAEHLRSDNAVVEVPAMEFFDSLASLWEKSPDETMMNEALRSVIKRIYVHRANAEEEGLVGRLEIIAAWENDPHEG